MDTPETLNAGHGAVLAETPVAMPPRSIWSQPLGQLGTRVLDNQDAIKDFLSLTGGSILYCLSALSIIYGITQIVGPPLATSNALGDILPCVFVLNGYELALLGVLALIVTWRHVTDDAISLVLLVAVFLIGSGMTLGVVAPSGLDICLAIGLACTVLGLVKLYVLRRFIALQFGPLACLGMTLILAWNFLASALMARPMMARTATDEIRRNQWLLAWLVLLVGAVLIVAEAARRKLPVPTEKNRRTAFLYGPAMPLTFFLVLLAAAGLHQYGIAYMFAVDYEFGDFIPLIAVGALLGLELIRSLSRPWKEAEVVLAALPLAATLLAVANKATVVPSGLGPGLLWSPPVVLGLTGIAVLWLSFHHKWYSLFFVALAYALGVLLVIGKPHQLNWELGGLGLIILLAAFALMKRNAPLCFATVMAVSIGLGMTETFTRFAEAHHLAPWGAACGVAGLGSVLISLTFGPQTPRSITFFGVIALVIFVFSCIPKPLHWADLGLVAITLAVSAALWFRTREILAALALWVPVAPKAYRFATEMSAWSFVALSFLLLFAGAAVSLFCKNKGRATASPQSDDSLGQASSASAS